MKKLIFLWLILTGFILGQAKYFLPIPVESSEGRPIKNQNVDLYQSGSKTNDLTWLSAGWYYWIGGEDTVVAGLYDVYVNDVEWRTNIAVNYGEDSQSTQLRSDIGDSVATWNDTTQIKLSTSVKGYLISLSSTNPNGGGIFIAMDSTDAIAILGRATPNKTTVFNHPTAGVVWVRGGMDQYQVNVLWYGALRDSSVNASTAIQSAINYAYLAYSTTGTRYEVYIPSGYYLLESSITIKEGVTVRMHPNAVLYVKSDIDVIILDGTCRLYGGKIEINVASYTHSGIIVGSAKVSHNDCIVSDLIMWGPYRVGSAVDMSGDGGKAIYLYAPVSHNIYFNKFTNVAIYGFEYGIYLDAHASSNKTNGNQFSNFTLMMCKYNIYIGSYANANQFSGIQIQAYIATDSTVQYLYCNGDYNQIEFQAWDPQNLVKASDDSAIHFDDLSSENIVVYNYLPIRFYTTDQGARNNLTHNIWIMYMNFNELRVLAATTELDSSIGTDTKYILLPTQSHGWGEIMLGNNEEWAHFRWNTNSTPVLIDSTSNVVTTNTNGKLCIYDIGSYVAIRNRIGDGKMIAYKINYYTP